MTADGQAQQHSPIPESSVVVRPQPMDSPTYTASSRLQAAGLNTALALFEDSARIVPLPKAPQPLTIADYGAATGYNSLLPISAAIRILRQRTRANHAILIAHTDVADNDFTALFTTLSDDPDSYLHQDALSFPCAVGRSFYNQILPSSSIALGWSSWAIHWLSKVPMPIPQHVHISSDVPDHIRTAYARQAADDWQKFIAFRGRELAPGARLVILTLAHDDDGSSGFSVIFDALTDVLHDIVATGLVTVAEVAAMTIPTMGRSAEEFRAPFAPSGRFEGLSIEHLELFHAEDRFWAQYLIDHDAEVFGTNWAGVLRSSALPTLVSFLTHGVSDTRAEQFADFVETGVARRLASNPTPMDIPLAALVLEKRR